MKEYEMIHEILNQCPLNHSRDQFLEEIECTDPEAHLKGIYGKENEFTMDKTLQKDGTLIFDIYVNGLHHRYTFSEI